MLGIPPVTPYDLKFRLLGIPVRVHPFFWLLAAFLGWNGRSGGEVVVWMACVFVSVLVHEYGHGLTARRLTGQQPQILLHQMGGLCVYNQEDRSPWRRLAVIAMGPGAGLLCFALIAGVGTVVTGIGPFGWQVHDVPAWLQESTSLPLVWEAYSDLLIINLVWSIFNLVPIYPLDGGQIAYTFLSMHNRVEGARRCYILSIGVAAVIAIYFYQRDELYNALLIGYFGLVNFQSLQALQMGARYGNSFEDDDQWWRR